MNRIAHHPRRRARVQTGPLVAFLIIASFGILFAGCSNNGQLSIKGPEDVTADEFSFTEDDVSTFQELASGSIRTVESGSSIALSTGTQLEVPVGLLTGSALNSALPVLDLSMAKKYESIRSGLGTTGPNIYRVTNTFLNVRAEPRSNAATVGKLNEGETLTLLEFINASWAKVRLANGKEGFVASKYIGRLTSDDRLAEEKKPYVGLYFVHFGFVNVRKEPKQQSEKLGTIPGQAFVRPIAIQDGWARVPFQGKEGFVSMQYLTPFMPTFLTRQERFTIPILRYHASQEGMLPLMTEQITRLKQERVKFLTFSTLRETLLRQEQRSETLPSGSVMIVVTDITPQSAKSVSDVLYAAGVPATFFIQTQYVGMAGITEKMLMTFIANGFDIQSAAHTGDDLRSLTNAQVKLEIEQSRKILEDMTEKTVFALDYPQGGVNDRVLQKVSEAGYLFGVGNAPEKVFTRDQFLRLPSYSVTSSMTPEDILRIVK